MCTLFFACFVQPTLTGQRIRTRKRDEKEKYEPTVFSHEVVTGIKEAKGDYDAVRGTVCECVCVCE